MSRIKRCLFALAIIFSLEGCSQKKSSCFFEVCVADRHTAWTLFFKDFKQPYEHYKFSKEKRFFHKGKEIKLQVNLRRFFSRNDTWRWLGDNLGFYLIGLPVKGVYISSKDKKGFPIDYLSQISNIESEVIKKISSLETDKVIFLKNNSKDKISVELTYRNNQKVIKFIYIRRADNSRPMAVGADLSPDGDPYFQNMFDY